MTALVDVTELLGSEVLLHVLIGNVRLLARVSPRTAARPGQEVQLLLDPARLHLFDPETELVLGEA